MTFMGLRIKVENGELGNSVTQQIRGAPDSKVEDALFNAFVLFFTDLLLLKGEEKLSD